MSGVRRFKRYPAYKDSGVQWLGDVPTHWVLTKMWNATRAVSGATPPKEDLRYWNGGIPWVSAKDMKRRFIDSSEDTVSDAAVSETGLKLIAPPAVLVVVRGMILAHTLPVALTRVPLTINQDMKALRLRRDLRPEFFVYWLQGVGAAILAAIVEEAAHGTKVIRMDRWRVTPVQVPSAPEQDAIIHFLDQETAKIDALIAKKERLIELLQEERAALVTRAVTKGLDPGVSMKDSGVEWLGDIPEHWHVKRLKYLLSGSIQNGLFKKKEQFGSGTLLVNVFDVYRDDFVVDVASLDRVSADEREHRAYTVAPGDIVFVRSSLKLDGVGRCAVVPDTSEPVVFECHLVRPRSSSVRSRYLLAFLNSTLVRQRLVALANSVTMSTLPQDAIGTLEVPVPSPPEQAAITAFLDVEAARTKALVGGIFNAINRLKELRLALISATVTGKIDVRAV